MSSSGRSQRRGGGDHKLGWGRNLLFSQIFLKTLWKWRKLGRSGESPKFVNVDLPLYWQYPASIFSISIRITYAKPVPGWSLQYWRCIDHRHQRVLPSERLSDFPDTCSGRTPASCVLVHQNLEKLGWNLLLEPEQSGKEGNKIQTMKGLMWY